MISSSDGNLASFVLHQVLELFRTTEILLACSYPAAAPTYELPVLDQLFELIEIRLQVTNVVQQT